MHIVLVLKNYWNCQNEREYPLYDEIEIFLFVC